MLRHVIVPLDGSDLAEAAIPFAREIVERLGQITLLSVLNPPEIMIRNMSMASTGTAAPGMAGTLPGVSIIAEESQEMWETAKTQTEAYLQRVAQGLRQDGFNAVVNVQVGNPADVIVDTAEELNVDAIVISTHGHTGLSRWLFGSVTQKILNAAPCPIFIIPSEEISDD